jgi:phosphoribosylglycinamide formyltransferase-1
VSLELGVLASGGGSNLQAILDAIQSGQLDAACRIVVCNRPDAGAIPRARAAGVSVHILDHKQYSSREAFDAELVRSLKAAGVEWVALAGFMRVLSPVFLGAFPQRVVNIHPSLLPAFPGVNAQEQAFRYGVKITGCTVHFVDGGVDTGPIIRQCAVAVLDTDTETSLRARILEHEHKLFVEALSAISRGEVRYPQRTPSPPSHLAAP